MINLKNRKNLTLTIFFSVLFLNFYLSGAVFAGSATLTWNANTESDLSGYKIYYGTSPRTGTDPKTCGNCGYSTNVSVGNVLTHTFSNLTDGSTYYFSISAYDTSNNKSSFSGEVSKVISAPDTAVPSAPTNLSAIVISSSQINLSWSASTDNVGVTGYKVYRSGAQIATSTTNSYSDTGLTASTAYSYAIAAYDAASNVSSQSSSVSATTQTPPDTTSPSISNISSTVSTTSATITFTLSETAISYIEYGLTTAYGLSTATTTASSITISNLNPNTTYNFRIISIDSSNNQTTSQNYTFATQQVADTSAPSAISDLSASDISQTYLTLAWTAPSDTSGVISYDIRYSTSQITSDNFSQATKVSSIPTPAKEGTKEQTYISVGLIAGTTYYFAIKSTDSVGNVSNISNIVQAITAQSTTTSDGGGSGGAAASDTTPPGPPSSATITPTDSQITISWENPTDSDFVRVRILMSETNYPSSPTDGTLIYEGDQTTFTDTELQNDKTYYYTLYSYDKIPNYSTPVKLQATPKVAVTETSTTETTASTAQSSIKEGSLIRGPDKIKVYIVNAYNFKRHVFNPAIFNMYGHFKWNEIKDIDQKTLDSYAISDLYREEKDPKVFLLKEIDEAKGLAEKRWLDITGERFTQLGYKWEQVFIINDKERDYYQEGTAITENESEVKAAAVTTLAPYSLAKTALNPTVYFITEKGIKKPILNEQVFNSYSQNKWENIITANEETLAQYPTATTIKLQGDANIYMIDFNNKTKKWIKTADAFNRLGFSWDAVVDVNQTEFNAYTDAGAVE